MWEEHTVFVAVDVPKGETADELADALRREFDIDAAPTTARSRCDRRGIP